VHLAHNGKCSRFDVSEVGTNAGTLTAYLGVQTFKPDLVISAGTAGGFRARGAEIGDVFVSTAIQNHDRRIPLPGFDKYGVGREEPHGAEKLIKELGTHHTPCVIAKHCSTCCIAQHCMGASYCCEPASRIRNLMGGRRRLQALSRVWSALGTL
jgi:Phosphorylase superfamily